MIKIAIADDEENDLAVLKNFLERYQKEENEVFNVKTFANGLLFLEGHEREAFDIIFLDIEMPHCDGMQAAKKLRKSDQTASLIFVTNMGQFAVRGYDVDAIGFIVKPVSYPRFYAILNKALVRTKRRANDEIVVQTPGGKRRIKLSDISYIQIKDHLLIYHIKDGYFESWQSLKEAENNLPADMFAKCNKSVVVNFGHIKAIEKNTVTVGKDSIFIARREKKDFMTKFTMYFGD